MLPKLSDWIRNPQKAATDTDSFSIVAESATQPLVAYEKAIAGLRKEKIIYRTHRPLIALAFVMLATSLLPPKSSTHKHNQLMIPPITSEIALLPFLLIGRTFFAARGMRARSASSLTLRHLHPVMAEKFDLIEQVLDTKPKVHPKDFDAAIERATKMRNYALRLGVQL